jgi:hypothetical protein
MAKKRTKVPGKIREKLIEEAGGKCANPGCANRRTEAHHIREWAVYETHNAKDMIAICPACHDAVHHGDLPLSDEILREWKLFPREKDIRDHIWVEPGTVVRLLLGSIAVESEDPMTVFELSEHNALSFRVEGDDILLASLRITSASGEEVVSVDSNNLRHSPRADISYRRIPGRIEIYVPASEEFIPAWALAQKRFREKFYGLGDRVKYLGLRVVKPGLLRVEGVWAEDERVVIISDRSLSFCRPGLREPISLVGEGESSILHWAGPINSSMFGIAPSKGAA